MTGRAIPTSAANRDRKIDCPHCDWRLSGRGTQEHMEWHLAQHMAEVHPRHASSNSAAEKFPSGPGDGGNSPPGWMPGRAIPNSVPTTREKHDRWLKRAMEAAPGALAELQDADATRNRAAKRFGQHQRREWTLMSCPECRALVLPEHEQEHREWHRG